MSTNFHGSFVFVSQGYGILSSVYNNSVATEPFPETSKKKKDLEKTKDLFEGLYTTVWLELGHHMETSDLEISRQPDDTYKLRWFDSTKIWYHGVGFINDNKLVGTYWP